MYDGKVTKINGRKLVYWGAGKFGQTILSERTDYVPAFVIDSRSLKPEICGVTIMAPEKISDWKKLYVVITVSNSNSIIDSLNNKGLKYGEDYISCFDFFEMNNHTIDDCLDEMKRYRAEHPKERETVIVRLPLFSGRQKGTLFDFISKYISVHKNEAEYIIITGDNIGGKDTSSLSAPVFTRPRFSSENVIAEEMTDDKYIEWCKTNVSLVDENEIKLIKMFDDYVKGVIEILHPDSVMLWGGWNRLSNSFAYHLRKRNIKYKYLEHGWLPGTIQCDDCGIAGNSIYTKHPEVLDEIVVSYEDIEETETIIKYIVDNQLDTSEFVETKTDSLQLEKMVQNRKTIFLVGMDENGMRVLPNSELWKKAVSDAYSSISEVLVELANISIDRGYNFIFKPHPGNHYDDIAEQYPNIIYVKDKSVDYLIKKSDVVISMSSAVEYKVLMYGKPVVQVGISSLNKKGCTYEVHDKENLGNILIKAVENGMITEMKDKFVIFISKLLKQYLWDDMTERPVRYGRKIEDRF